MESFNSSTEDFDSENERFSHIIGQNKWSDEKELIKLLAKGNEEAYRYIYRRYAPKIGALAKGYLGSDDVDDIIQEVFLRIHKSIKKFRGDSKLSTWIYKITINVCNNVYKKLKNRDTLVDFSETNNNDDEYCYQHSTEEDVQKNVINEIEIDILRKALAKLSPEDRTILYMKEVDGLTYAEIGKILDKPEGTIKSKLHYIKELLKSFLGEAFRNGQD
ncbi:RNA polymerase sigma factor [Fervidobacterium sp.]